MGKSGKGGVRRNSISQLKKS